MACMCTFCEGGEVEAAALRGGLHPERIGFSFVLLHLGYDNILMNEMYAHL